MHTTTHTNDSHLIKFQVDIMEKNLSDRKRDLQVHMDPSIRIQIQGDIAYYENRIKELKEELKDEQ